MAENLKVSDFSKGLPKLKTAQNVHQASLFLMRLSHHIKKAQVRRLVAGERARGIKRIQVGSLKRGYLIVRRTGLYCVTGKPHVIRGSRGSRYIAVRTQKSNTKTGKIFRARVVLTFNDKNDLVTVRL